MDAYMLRRACAATEPIVEQVTPGDYANRTPCTEWDVHDLVNHLLGTLELGRALFSDTAPETDAGPGEVPSADLAGDDPAKAYRVGMESLLAAATGDAVDRAHATPFGEMPGAMVAGFTAVDVLVHGWDLARATGQTVGFDDALAGEILGFARQTISDDTRAPRIGPEVPAPDGASASAIDRLVAFMGRTP
jgi:uncharacterized protein (TIGR03086 family)